MKNLPLFPTLMTIPAILILLSLGFWQIERLKFKEQYLAQLSARMDLTPTPLPVNNASDLNKLTREAWEFMPIEIIGEFLHDQEIHVLQRGLNGKEGLNIYTPFKPTQFADHANKMPLLINRGFVPFERKAPNSRLEGQIKGEVKLQGLLRFNPKISSIRQWVLPEPNIEKNLWYALDINKINLLLKTNYPQIFIIDGDETRAYPKGHQWKITIHNDHLQYAITWFLLAIGLAAIYVIYVRQWHNEIGRNESGRNESKQHEAPKP